MGQTVKEQSGGRLLRVLLVEDSRSDALLVLHQLKAGGYQPEYQRVETEAGLRTALLQQTWDIVIADYSMPSFNALDALQVIHATGGDLPFIIVSGTIGEECAVDAMKAGAHDYVMKDSLTRLLPAVEREVRDAAERAARHRAEQALAHQALHDSLTDLPNRTLFYDRLQQAILSARRNQASLALLVMDLDRFKEVNDTFGHHYGDIVLQQTAERLRTLLRGTDTVARLGGDEFALVLPDAGNASGAISASQKIMRTLEAPFLVEGRALEVGSSIGIALWPGHGLDAGTLLRHADVAMYSAKREHSGWAVYSPDQDEHSPAALALLGELRTAIDTNQLVLHYQPKVSLRSAGDFTVEALVRWRHPRHGLLLPDAFIPSAEQSGLIRALTRWVLDSALDQCRRWQDDGQPVGVAVNLSMQDLRDTTLPAMVSASLDKYQLNPSQLTLEITESALIGSAARAARMVRDLGELGVSLSIDDFGTGYSSLASLKHLTLHELKIDKSFVSGMTRDRSDAAIVQSTIELGHNLGLRVVAEGVEDAGVWQRLGELGCDAGQGHYLGRAVPADQIGTRRVVVPVSMAVS